MQVFRKHIIFLFSALLLCSIVYVIFPFYRFYIDTDATAYLAISQRYAAGDFFKAINGYWSPFACWMTAALIKAGYLPFTAAIIVNTIAAICFLGIAHSFFRLFYLDKTFRWILSVTLALFLSYAVFKQSFDDLWECFFLLVCLRILLHSRFLQRWDLWVWLGIFGGFAYYAKAYAFPFFIVSTICCGFYITRAWERQNRMKWIQISFTAIAVMIMIAFPWIFLLHEKYGAWMTSNAGTLNLSWYPVGHPYYKEGIRHLLPPVYPGSPSYWEDPWLVNGATPHFWNSPALFLRQMARTAYNVLLFVKCLGEISAFLVPVTVLAVCTLLSRKINNFFGKNFTILALSFLLFPLGFFLINFESRYIWYMLLPGMLLAAWVIQKLLLLPVNKTARYTAMLLFGFSFIVFPAWDMKQMYRAGEREFKMARKLEQLNVRGSFTANVVFGSNGGSDLEKVSRLAYFSGNPYYNMPYGNVPYKELLEDIRRYGVKYFYYYYNSWPAASTIKLYDENGAPFPEIAHFPGYSMKVFQIYP